MRVFQITDSLTFASEAVAKGGSSFQAKPLGSPAIDLQGISAWYGSRSALAIRDVSLRFEEGEFVFLSGSARAGKTTLMRLLTKYIPGITGAWSGELTVGGMDWTDLSIHAAARSVRYLAEETFDGIIGLTVEQQMRVSCASVAAAREHLAVLGIEHLWDREVHSLSGGERARLGLASLLASRAGVILLDNPLQELDQAGRDEFVRALVKLKAHYRPIIIVADPFVVEFLPYVTRFILLAAGSVVADWPGPLSVEQMRKIPELSLEPWSGPPAASTADAGLLVGMRNAELALGGRRVLNGLTLEVRSQEVVALVGANGSGKTTALLALSGLYAFKGERTGRLRARVGIVFQDVAAQLVGMTVAEELGAAASLRNERFAEDEAILPGWSGLRPDDKTLDLHPCGQRVLAWVAMSLAGELLVLDEPTLSLDSEHVRHCLRFVQEYVSVPGRAVVVATHDPRVVRIASRIISIKDGRESDGPFTLRHLGSHQITTSFGLFDLHSYSFGTDARIVLVLDRQALSADGVCRLRVQYGCVSSTALLSSDCDCADQMKAAMERIATSGGLLIYLPGDEGLGRGLAGKVSVVAAEMSQGLPPLAASERLGQPYASYASLTCVPFVLDALGIRQQIALLSNSPQKEAALRALGMDVVALEPLTTEGPSRLNPIAQRELREKRERLGHAV